jgi:hypothetical protein
MVFLSASMDVFWTSFVISFMFCVICFTFPSFIELERGTDEGIDVDERGQALDLPLKPRDLGGLSHK